MVEDVVVGGGFSALVVCARNHFKNVLITPKKLKFKKNLFAINKMFGIKSSSVADFKITPMVNLHERTHLGGNSAIWGGFTNIDSINKNAYDSLSALGIDFVPLSLVTTGSMSNVNGIRQLQYKDRVLNSANFLNPNIDDMVDRIEIDRGFIKLYFPGGDFVIANNVDLCVGVVQLVSILVNSGWIMPGDCITLEEFESNFQLSLTDEFSITNADGCVIKYGILRALNHAMGVQYKLFGDILPLYVDQLFLKNKKELVLTYLGDKNFIPNTVRFGNSIHYCNLRVNGEKITSFLSEIHPGLKVHGMASVVQQTPGPISQDIINGVWNYVA